MVCRSSSNKYFVKGQKSLQGIHIWKRRTKQTMSCGVFKPQFIPVLRSVSNVLCGSLSRLRSEHERQKLKFDHAVGRRAPIYIIPRQTLTKRKIITFVSIYEDIWWSGYLVVIFRADPPTYRRNVYTRRFSKILTFSSAVFDGKRAGFRVLSFITRHTLNKIEREM